MFSMLLITTFFNALIIEILRSYIGSKKAQKDKNQITSRIRRLQQHFPTERLNSNFVYVDNVKKGVVLWQKKIILFLSLFLLNGFAAFIEYRDVH